MPARKRNLGRKNKYALSSAPKPPADTTRTPASDALFMSDMRQTALLKIQDALADWLGIKPSLTAEVRSNA